MSKKMSIKSAIILLSAALIWGAAFSAQVTAGENGLGSFTFNGIRFLIGGISLIPVILIFERRKPSDEAKPFIKSTMLPAMLSGVFLFAAATLQQMGINIDKNGGKASFITGFYIVLVPIFSLILFKKKTGFNVWVGALLAVLGLYFIGVVPGEKISSGDLLVFAGAFFWAFQILTIDRYIGNAMPVRFAMIQFFTCGLIALVIALFTEHIDLYTVAESKWAILYAGVMSSGIAYTLQIIGQKGSDPAVASMLLSTESVFGALSGLLINHTTLSPRAIVGCVLMFAGITVSQIAFRRPVRAAKNNTEGDGR